MSAARCAIKMRSTELDRKVGVKLLKRDLMNGPNHCFGNHNQCSPDFCSTIRDQLSNTSRLETEAPVESNTDEHENDDNNDDLIGKRIS